MGSNYEAFTGIWRDLLNRYEGTPITVNFKKYVVENTEERRSDAYSHNIHSYPARIFPYIPIFIYAVPQLCPKNGLILDPFCGSGTTLLESIIHPIFRRNIYGVEINPLGRLIAKVKTTPIEEKCLSERIKIVKEKIRTAQRTSVYQPRSEKIAFWFSEDAIYEINRIKSVLEENDLYDDCSDFLWVCFSAMIRKTALADPFIPPPVLLKLKKYKNSPKKLVFLTEYLKRAQKPELGGVFSDIVDKNFNRIVALNNYIKETPERAKIVWNDAREIKLGRLVNKGKLDSSYSELPQESIDLILTSPPYLSAQKYLRTMTLELLWLGIISEQQLGKLDQQIIGTERVCLKTEDFKKTLDIESVDSLVKWASARDRERASIIAKYFLEMYRAISEMHRVLKFDSHAVLVVGNNKVLGKKIKTYSLLIDIAIKCGFKTEIVLKDKIRGRGMITKRHDTGGLIEDEYVIVLKKTH